jgi:hypothetical protein
MSATEKIPGYAYGSTEVARSPVSLEQFEQLKAACLFTEEDERFLRLAGEVLADQGEQVFQSWIGFVGPSIIHGWAGPDGQPNQAYLEATHPRFVQWIHDTCNRRYDQAWLDYQHEIGLRHHRTKKNLTDAAESVPNVEFRLLLAIVFPITRKIRPFLERGGQSREDVDKMLDAWTKSVLLQVTLWCHPYVKDGDW